MTLEQINEILRNAAPSTPTNPWPATASTTASDPRKGRFTDAPGTMTPERRAELLGMSAVGRDIAAAEGKAKK